MTIQIPQANTSYLTGQLLLAMPAMTDWRFHKAVILVCAHDQNGAMGLVINQTLPGFTMSQLLDQLKIKPDETPSMEALDSVPVMNGGPVEGARGFLLHGSDFRQADTVKVTSEFSITGTLDALKAVASGRGPRDLMFILGYAGWTAGQLDEELAQNAWLTAPADRDIIFHPDAETKWNMAFKSLGVDPAMLSVQGGRA
jgi:putative transcriptional regulator